MIASMASLRESPFPLVDAWWAQWLIVAGAYILTLWLSGPIVKYFVLPPGMPPPPPMQDGHVLTGPKPRFDAGAVIGKCENILVITMVLAGRMEGIGLIFAGKALARSEDIKRNPGYFLGGTLVNLVWALAVAILARLAAFGT